MIVRIQIEMSHIKIKTLVPTALPYFQVVLRFRWAPQAASATAEGCSSAAVGLHALCFFLLLPPHLSPGSLASWDLGNESLYIKGPLE